MIVKNNIHDLELPDSITDEMDDWFSSIVSSFPEQNITETVSEWAERKRVLGTGLTARPGRFDYNNTPYLREIADCLSDSSPVQEIYFMKATQIGANVGILENHQGYCIDYGIGPVLFISGDQRMAEESMEKRVDEMIASAGLQNKIRPNTQKRKQKSTGDRMDSKSYGGTFMRAVGPHSESKIRTFPSKINHIDEADIYPHNIKVGSGNPFEKIERRADSYGNLKKIIALSTPKNKSTSQIEPRFESGDKRYYHFQCPKCKKYQHFVWLNFRWDKKKDGSLDVKTKKINGVETILKDPTYYECINPKCKRKIRDHEKYELLLEEGRGGTAKWIPTKKADRPFLRSYHLSGLYGFRSWLDIALHFEKVKDDPLLWPDFVNDVRGETWEEKEEAPVDHELMSLAEDWECGYIHRDVVFLTLTADIQGDRIEASLMGWGFQKQGYMIDYWNLPGEPHINESECWKQLAEKIESSYKRSDGIEMRIQIAFIDSQYLKDQVNHFCEQFAYHPDMISGVYPILSRDVMTAGITTKVLPSEIANPVVGLADQKLKFALYNTLRKKPYSNGFPFGYIHFSKNYGREFYKQLTAEEVFVFVKKNGKKIITIENRKQRRNEVFDNVKYHLGAYQFAIDQYFYIANKKRTAQKLKPLQQDTELFMTDMENALYE